MPFVLALIPARGGSKGLPGKNVAPVGGVPLIARAARAATAAGVDRVVVSTDDEAIARVARSAGAETLERPAELADDSASSESALLHALDVLEAQPDVVVFLQATSPFIDQDALSAAIARVTAGTEDVVFSAAPSHAFLWRDADGGVEGVNHRSTERLRRQDRPPEYRETGAFYVMDAAGFRAARHRFFGRIGVQVVDEADAIEIDTPADLRLASALATSRRGGADALPGIDAVVTDFDGVHTDDTVTVTQSGEESVRVSRRDGHGVRMLREAGIPLLILSAERNPVVSARAAKLGVEAISGAESKREPLLAWAAGAGIDLDRVAYLGNDLADLPCFDAVGCAVAVADAHPAVLAAADVVLSAAGGRGAVRELAERVLAGRTITQEEPT